MLVLLIVMSRLPYRVVSYCLPLDALEHIEWGWPRGRSVNGSFIRKASTRFQVKLFLKSPANIQIDRKFATTNLACDSKSLIYDSVSCRQLSPVVQ